MNRFDIVVIEQADDRPFNRGKLINVGYLETRPDCFIAHDVDMIPLSDYDYRGGRNICQLAYSKIQTKDYLGGVTYFPDDLFTQELEGFHNDFWSRAEDNEMMFRIRECKLPVILRPGTFRELPHPRTGPEFIPELWQKAQLPRTKNMLKTCEYQLVSKEIKDGYTLIKVLL